jgi:leucyl aminopeptidase
MGAIARLNVPVPVVGVIPSAENMISGSATRPDDVVRTRAGLTIEVVNTDAEGRLILADALDFARKFRPSLLVDVATLTGACVVALGESIIGLLSNDPAAAERVRAAAASSGEAVWELPLYREFFERIQCDAADMKNSGGRSAGASTAAALLARFVEGVPWCHLDIAGPAWCEKEIGYRGRGATGAAVRLLIELARHEPPA